MNYFEQVKALEVILNLIWQNEAENFQKFLILLADCTMVKSKEKTSNFWALSFSGSGFEIPANFLAPMGARGARISNPALDLTYPRIVLNVVEL